MRMVKTAGLVISAIGVIAFSGAAFAATVSVGYDPSAPESNFGTPGPTSDQVAYTISLSEDATNLYGTIAANPIAGGTYRSDLLFSNLYFGVGASASTSSKLGIEITNDRAFVPGVSGYYSLAGTGFSFTQDAATGTITFSLPWAFLATDPLGIGFDKVTAANPDAILRLSQSLGYSVAGGTSFGPDRLGHEVAPVPLPPALGLMAAGSYVFGFARRRRASVTRLSQL